MFLDLLNAEILNNQSLNAVVNIYSDKIKDVNYLINPNESEFYDTLEYYPTIDKANYNKNLVIYFLSFLNVQKCTIQQRTYTSYYQGCPLGCTFGHFAHLGK